MNERDFVDWIVIVASILSSLGILATVIVYLLSKNDNKNEQDRKDNLAHKEINKLLDHYLKVVDDIKNFTDDIINNNLTYIRGGITNNKFIFMYAKDNAADNFANINIEYNHYGRLNSFLFNGVSFGSNTNNLMDQTKDGIDEINDYIKNTIVHIILKSPVNMESKINSMTGYVKAGIYKKHKKIITDIKIKMSK